MTVYYTKRFTSGNLSGLSVNLSLTFANEDLAFHFAKGFRIGTKHKDCLTRDRFIVTDLSFQKYDRS